jgi:UDP-N-acetylglucosamine:LPS N-acetylglucosamine transferase
MPAADVVVSGGGYHSFHELRAVGIPAVFIPQRRRYDDQHERVRGCLVAEDPASLEQALSAVLRDKSLPQALPPRLDHPEDGAEALARLVRARLDH